MDGVQETMHFCQGCAPPTGYEGLNPEQLEALSIDGKKCGLCGRDASSGVGGPQSPTFLCSDCGYEYHRLIGGMVISERPEWVQKFAAENTSPLSMVFNPLYREWWEAACQKALGILKNRGRQGDGDKTT